MKTLIRFWIARELAFIAYLYSDMRHGSCRRTDAARTHLECCKSIYNRHRDWLRNRKAAME